MNYIKTYEQNNGITFQQWLKDNPQDINITQIHCSNSNLIDLNGIEQFKNLQVLKDMNLINFIEKRT
jgi:accessory colonization factor AcfC